MKSGPAWNETLFVITFDEHGGIFDHAPPPYAENPWPNDVLDGFRFDMMGVRVPTILVSPLIKRQTVFRSPTAVAYDSTSILATLLNWYGVPKARWGLGERARHAPTFEGVFQLSEPRADKPLFEPPNIEESSRSRASATSTCSWRRGSRRRSPADSSRLPRWLQSRTSSWRPPTWSNCTRRCSASRRNVSPDARPAAVTRPAPACRPAAGHGRFAAAGCLQSAAAWS